MRQIVTTYPPGLRRVEEKGQHLNDWNIVSPRATSSTDVTMGRSEEADQMCVNKAKREKANPQL